MTTLSKLKDVYLTITTDFQTGKTELKVTANGYQKYVRAAQVDESINFEKFDRRKVNPFMSRVENLLRTLDEVFKARADDIQRKIDKRKKDVSGSPWGVPYKYSP